MNRLTQSLLLVAACCATLLICQLSWAQSEPSFPDSEPNSFQIESIDLQPAQSAYYEVGDLENEHEKISRCEQRSPLRTSIFSYLPWVGRFFDGSADSEVCAVELPILSRRLTWQRAGQPQTEPQIEVTVQQPRAAALRALLSERAVHNRELRKIPDAEKDPNIVSAKSNASSSKEACQCYRGEPCNGGLHVPDGGTFQSGVVRRAKSYVSPTPSYSCTELCCVETKTCTACTAIPDCKCEGECKCCDASRGESCACSNCGCGKEINSECKCEGTCACGTGSRGGNCVCGNCRCATDEKSSNQLLALGQKIDSPEDLSAFITHVVKKYASGPYRDEAKEQMAEALIALATENFKMNVQMLVHGNEHRSAEKVNELRQEIMAAQLENVRLQAQLEASEKLLRIAGEFYENPRNQMLQPFYSPQVINVPPQIEGWQAPVRLATPQTLPAPHFDPYQSPPTQPAQPQTYLTPPPTGCYDQPAGIGPPVNTGVSYPQNPPTSHNSNVQSNQPNYQPPHYNKPHHGASNSPQLQERIEQLEREIAQLREARAASVNCLPRPMYPTARVEPAQFSTPAAVNSGSAKEPMMMVTPRMIIQEQEEELLVAPPVGR